MKYYLIAGEASGDLHASNLMKGLLAEDPGAQFRFRGGDLMKAVGGTMVRHYKEGAVMGASDVLRKAGSLVSDLNSCKADILEYRPDVVILVDYPGFNMRIAEFAHSKGIRVFYYIAPKTWASREGRNRKLRKWVDMVYIVFPFEIPYFTKAGVPFRYFGNPLVEAVDSRPGAKEKADSKTIAILPGSRKGEISRTMPQCIRAADMLHADPRYADWSFVVAGAPSRDKADYTGYIGDRDYVSLEFGKTYDIVGAARAAVINSGTASLEAALIGTPQVVCYSTTPLSAFLAKKVLRIFDRIKYISLGNLIVDRLVFRELIQDDFTPEAVVNELRRILEDATYSQAMTEGYAEIRERLGSGEASRAFARDMINLLKSA